MLRSFFVNYGWNRKVFPVYRDRGSMSVTCPGGRAAPVFLAALLALVFA